jgi:hypothetical protein
MEISRQQINAFRYWIQGYPNFYEPIVMEWFKVTGYHVLRRPAVVSKPDIQRVIDALFDGTKRLGANVDTRAVIAALKKRARLQPDLLLERDGRRYLAELKSWGGFNSGLFTLATLTSEFIRKPDTAAFLLVDQLDGQPIAGKMLVVSARCPQHDQVFELLQSSFQTRVELLYLDEVLRTPQLAGIIDRQLRYLEAAVAELRAALRPPSGGSPL